MDIVKLITCFDGRSQLISSVEVEIWYETATVIRNRITEHKKDLIKKRKEAEFLLRAKFNFWGLLFILQVVDAHRRQLHGVEQRRKLKFFRINTLQCQKQL